MIVGRDLMVGDWVSAPYTIEKRRNIQVEEIICDEINPCWDGMENYGGIKIEYLEPIPLTQEILVRNNFHHIRGGAWDYFSIKGIEWFDLYKEENGFALHIGQSEVYLNYVHELQHALRLCKIEKEIEL